MSVYSGNCFSCLHYGKHSCLLDGYHGEYEDVFEIPSSVDGYSVNGFTVRFARSIKYVKTLVIPENISNIALVTTNKDFKILMESLSWQSIQVAEGNRQYKSIDGVLFSKTGQTLVLYPPAKEDAEYYIPDEVESVSLNAFCYNPNLQRLSFGMHFKAIDISTISYCNALRAVKIFNPKASLQEWAFKFCASLENISFPNGSFKYEVHSNAVYQKMDGLKNKLLLFPPAMNVKHYVVPADTTSMSSAAVQFLSSVPKVHVPEQCKLPYVLKENHFSFYQTQNTVPGVYIRKPMETYNRIESKEGTDTKPQRGLFLERMLSANADEGFLTIPSYKNYKELEYAVKDVISIRALKLLESIKLIILPNDMESVEYSFFTKFINLAEIKCNGKGSIHVEDNVLYEGDTIVFYPPFSKKATISIKKDHIRVGEKAFYHNQYLVNLILDCPQISLGRNVFEGAIKIQNLVLAGTINSIGKNVFIKSKSPISVYAWGNIKSCSHRAFGGVSGIAKLFVLTINERNYLTTNFGGTDCAVTMITQQRMVELLEILSRKYRISMSFVSKQLSSPKINQNRAFEKLPRNARVEIKVTGHKFSCINKNHHLVTKRVSLDMIDENHNYRTVDIDVGYCAECKNYFVYSNVFRAVQEKIERYDWRLVGAYFYYPQGRHYGYLLEGIGEFREESILKVCGYTVGKNSKLNPTQRIDILSEIINRKWLSKQGVMSYLNWFIDVHSHINNHQWAVDDWRQDLKTLDAMKF